eukprot:6183377-Pleurochrysis_carterae.AAC.1
MNDNVENRRKTATEQPASSAGRSEAVCPKSLTSTTLLGMRSFSDQKANLTSHHIPCSVLANGAP